MVHAQYNGCLISGRHIPERLTDGQKRIWDDLWTGFVNMTSLTSCLSMYKSLNKCMFCSIRLACYTF